MGEIRIKSGNLYPIEMKDDAWITFHGGQIISRSDNVLQVLTSNSEQASGVYTGSLRQLSTLSDTVSMSADICCDNPNAKLLIGFETDGKLLSETSCTSEFQHYEVNNFTFSKEQNFIVYCFNKQVANIYIKNLMINLGSTALPYQPYFLNRPAHQYINGEWIDIPTHHYINNRWQGELTSQSPLKFRADGEMLDWRVEGKTSENLFDISTDLIPHLAFSSGKIVILPINTAIGFYVKCQPNKYYTLSRATNTNNQFSIGFTAYEPVNGTPLLSYTPVQTPEKSVTALSPSNANYLCAYLTNQNDPITEDLQLMLNEGETALPYEPYGSVGDWDETEQKYRIPVTVNGTTTNIFTDHQLMDGDSIDYATDQTTIPIATGNNVLSIDTAVQPKSVFVKFEG